MIVGQSGCGEKKDAKIRMRTKNSKSWIGQRFAHYGMISALRGRPCIQIVSSKLACRVYCRKLPGLNTLYMFLLACPSWAFHIPECVYKAIGDHSSLIGYGVHCTVCVVYRRKGLCQVSPKIEKPETAWFQITLILRQVSCSQLTRIFDGLINIGWGDYPTLTPHLRPLNSHQLTTTHKLASTAYLST
jgi:hypothetical protein